MQSKGDVLGVQIGSAVQLPPCRHSAGKTSAQDLAETEVGLKSGAKF